MYIITCKKMSDDFIFGKKCPKLLRAVRNFEASEMFNYSKLQYSITENFWIKRQSS